MADDPTIRFSLQRTRECPTCGNKAQPEEKECSLCGTLLPQAVLAPTVTVPPQDEVADATVVEPPLRKPLAQEATVKVARPEPTPLSSSSQSKPAASPVVKPTSVPPPRPVQPPITLPPPHAQANPLLRWGALAVGTVALFLLSFFTAKMFLAARGGKVEESLPPVVTSDPEKGTRSDKGKEESAVVVPPPPPVQPQLVGRVTTAEQLLTIRIFGADPNDALRGTAAIRTQVEKILKGIRDVYTAYLETNPQSFGVVILEFSIVPGGRVSSTVLHTTGSAGRELEQSITSLVKEWQFPITQGGEVKVFYPLLLSPEKIDPMVLVSHMKDVWPGRYKVLAATPVPVHTEANESAQEVGAIGPGMFLSVVSSRDGWLGALSPKGKVGYVQQGAIFPRVENPSAGDAKG